LRLQRTTVLLLKRMGWMESGKRGPLWDSPQDLLNLVASRGVALLMKQEVGVAWWTTGGVSWS